MYFVHPNLKTWLPAWAAMLFFSCSKTSEYTNCADE